MPIQAGSAYIDLVPQLGPDFNARIAAGVEAAAGPAAQRFGDAFSSAGDSLMRAGMRLTTFVTLPLLLAAGAAFKFASDLNESINKVNVVFGNNAGVVQAWSKTAAESLGMSRQQALEAAGTFGNLFRALGIGIPTATDMSTKIVGLASDLASFNNANPAEVLEALRAGLVGEAEPLRKFGINLNQARIEAKALELGLWDGVNPIDANAKAQAAYALILDDTTLAQGDFARTSDGAANKGRILAAKVKDLAADVGTKLLPIGEKLLGWANDLLDTWGKLGPVGQDLALAVGAIAAAAGPASVGLGGIAKIVGLVAANPIILVAAAVAALVAGAIALGIYWDEVWKFVSENPYIAAAAALLWPILIPIFAIVGAIKFLADNWDEIWSAITDVGDEFVTWVESTLGPTWDRIVELAGVVGDRLSEIFDAVFPVIEGIINAGIDGLVWLWDNFGGRIVSVLETAWGFVEGFLDAGLQIINGILDTFIGLFSGNWDRLWNGLTEIVGGIWDGIVNAINAGIALIGNALGGIWDVVTTPFRLAWDGILAIVGGISEGIRAGFAAIPGLITSAVGAVGNAAASVGNAIVNGIVGIVNGAVGIAGDIAGAVLSLLKRAWNTAINAINDAIPNDLSVGPISVDLPDRPFDFAKLHTGGLIPGSFGEEVMVIAKAGERVSSARATDTPTAGAGSLIGDVTIYARDATGAAEELAWLAYTA